MNGPAKERRRAAGRPGRERSTAEQGLIGARGEDAG